jgi:hypothetical protein
MPRAAEGERRPSEFTWAVVDLAPVIYLPAHGLPRLRLTRTGVTLPASPSAQRARLPADHCCSWPLRGLRLRSQAGKRRD